MEKTILALGSDIKNRFLFVSGKKFYFGPKIGDLSDVGNYTRFSKELKKTMKNTRPDIIACDLHPGYFSTKLSDEFLSPKKKQRVVKVQHHHAHIASIMQEHNIKSPVIGVAFDGTGFGLDGNIWGGEFLKVWHKGFKRLAHFKYISMPGAEKCIREPWRMVLSILGNEAKGFLGRISSKDKKIVLSMLSKNINSPLTSSAGRIFDAASALIGVCTNAAYEAQGPIQLEAMCKKGFEEKYPFNISKNSDGMYTIDTKPVFQAMQRDLKKKIQKNIIATKFHNTIVAIAFIMCKKLSKETQIKNIVLSGGVFQNKFLFEKLTLRLKNSSFNVYTNKITVNDFNISLGQYYVSSSTCKN